MTPLPTTLAELADLLPRRVQDHYGDDDGRTTVLRQELRRFADDQRPVDRGTLAELETAAQRVFRHLQLEVAAGLVPATTSAGWPEPDLAAVRRAGAGVAAVERHPDGTGVLRLSGLAPAAAAAPLLAGAFALLRGAGSLVLDLRANGGGDPATVALLVDWLAGGPPRHLVDVRYRDRTRSWWTAGAALADPPGVPVRALVGPGTYSSGECLAWVLQRQQLATLVGERTPGAADHVVPLDLCHDVRALLPEARVLAPDGGPTWEGTGVVPDELDQVEA